tara:strand:+ start:737 stop:2191 length:1455 start_codon:yes stop_codon:yes gene_type:complete
MEGCDAEHLRRVIGMSEAYMPAVHERVYNILRMFSYPYLYVMAMNDLHLQIHAEDSTGIPTLTGFASFIDVDWAALQIKPAFDTMLGGMRKQCIPSAFEDTFGDTASLVISLFYAKDTPAWNMLGMDEDIQSLDVYLANTHTSFEGRQQASHCEVRIADEHSIYMLREIGWPDWNWPSGHELEGIKNAFRNGKNYAFDFAPVLIDCIFDKPGKTYTLVCGLTLPLRVMRHKSLATCNNNSKCISLNITTRMLRKVIHECGNENDGVLAEILRPELLPIDSGLDSENSSMMAGILISSWGGPYLKDLLNRPIFQNFMKVYTAISIEVGDWGHSRYLKKFATFRRSTWIDRSDQEQENTWLHTPFHHDWGNTTSEKHVINVDRDLMSTKALPLPYSGVSPSFCYDLRLVIHCSGDDLKPWDRYQVVKGEIICELLETNFRPSDLRPLTMKRHLSWARHTFPAMDTFVVNGTATAWPPETTLTKRKR